MTVVDSKLKFSDQYSSRKPLIFEVDEAALESFLDSSSVVKFDEKGVAYLTNKKDTYRVRHVDNSNTQLVVDDKSFAIQCSTPGVICLERVIVDNIPSADIRSVIEKHPGAHDIQAYLKYHTIWSEMKLQEFLAQSDFCYMENGCWRMLSESDLYELTQYALNACAVVGKSLLCSQSSEMYNSEEVWLHLNEFLREEGRREVSVSLVQFLLSRMSAVESSFYTNKGATEWPLNIPLAPTRIVTFQGHYVLFKHLTSTGNPHMSISRFMNELKELLTQTPSVDSSWIDTESLVAFLPSILDTIGFQDDNGFIVWLPARELAFQLEERIQQLFRARKVWAKDEMERLVSPLLSENVKTEGILMKSGCRLETTAADDDDYVDGGIKLFYSYKFLV